MDASPLPRRILLIGVASSTRLLIRHVLQNLGYSVDEIADPDAARPSGHALVVLGARSIGDGLAAVVLALRAEAGRTPMIVVGEAEALAESGARVLDVQACLPEPIEFGQFLATVRGLLDDAAQHARENGRLKAPQPVDLDRLHSFTGDDLELVLELSTLYFATADAYLADMAEALTTGASASRAVHSLKGASANFGAIEVAELASIAEQNGVTPARLAGLREALRQAEQFMAGIGMVENTRSQNGDPATRSTTL